MVSMDGKRCVVMEIMLKKENIPKYDIIQIIFKCCVSQIYLIVLLLNIKITYDQIYMIKK